jgi:hypothetical protein
MTTNNIAENTGITTPTSTTSSSTTAPTTTRLSTVDYLTTHRLQSILEHCLQHLVTEQPQNPFKYLSNEFTVLANNYTVNTNSNTNLPSTTSSVTASPTASTSHRKPRVVFVLGGPGLRNITYIAFACHHCEYWVFFFSSVSNYLLTYYIKSYNRMNYQSKSLLFLTSSRTRAK